MFQTYLYQIRMVSITVISQCLTTCSGLKESETKQNKKQKNPLNNPTNHCKVGEALLSSALPSDLEGCLY